MSAETKKVLEMLAAGNISSEDAERLLDKLSASGGAAPSAGGAARKDGASAGSATETPRPRFIRIEVERPGREDIHVRVPLSNARGGLGLMAFLPTRVAEKLHEYGCDFGSLDRLDEPDFRKLIERLNVDITKGNGQRVRIYAE